MRLFYGILICILLVSFLPRDAHAQKRGAMRYEASAKSMQFYDGTRWYNFGLGLPVASCDVEGKMDYDPLLTLLGSYRFCNGNFWIQVIGVTTLSLCSKRAEIEVVGGNLFVCDGLFWNNIRGLVAA